MQAPSWIALLKLIPANLHDTLVLITTTSIEVMVQRLLRVEQDYVVFRGRMSGTMDSGRVMIMPYDQISNVAFNKRMSEPEAHAIFGGLGGWVPEAVVGAAGEAPSELTADAEQKETTTLNAAPPPASEPAPPQPAAAVAKPEHASKSLLLARLRARLGANAKK